MIYISLTVLAILFYELIRLITDDIKAHITKEADRIIKTTKNEKL